MFAFGAAAQNISLNINTPAAGSLVGDNLSVVVGTTSTYEIQSVTATVANRATNLVYSMNVGWTGTVSLLGLPRGPQTLIVKAVDFFRQLRSGPIVVCL